MKRSLFRLFCFIISLNMIPVSAQKFVANYDESKLPVYTLPDPLVFYNRDKVRTRKEWDKRRDEIFKIFENEVYGISPVWKGEIIPTELSSKTDALTD